MSNLVPTDGQGAQRVALYARVSSEDQAERGTIQAQRDFLRNFAHLYQLDAAGEYVDDGVSGTVTLGDRPDGRRLLDDARRGVFTTVLVYRLDRLGRSLTSLLDAHAVLEGLGVTIRSATEPFDTSTPIGRFLFQLLGSLAELERSTITERMTLGRDRVARDGKWTSGPIPFGYDLDQGGHLAPSERPVDGLAMTEADLARSIFERIAAGSSTVAECRRLNALGVPTSRRYSGGAVVTVGTTWRPSRINAMVKNEAYAGEHVFESRGGTIRRAVPALVDRRTWERAQEQLTRNRALSTKNARRRYLLRGLITCSLCGVKYVGTTNRSSDGWTGHYYRCGSQLAAMHPTPGYRCPSKNLPAAWLEQLVWSDCRSFILDPRDALEEARHRLQELAGHTEGLTTEEQRLRHLLADKQAERDRVLTLYRRGIVSLAEVEEQFGAVRGEIEQIELLLAAVQAQRDLANASAEEFADAESLLIRLREGLEEIERTDDWDAKRQIVELLVAGVRVDTIREGSAKRATLTILYTFGPGHHVVDATTGSRARSHGTG